jgi:hypothetical protein
MRIQRVRDDIEQPPDFGLKRKCFLSHGAFQIPFLVQPGSSAP